MAIRVLGRKARYLLFAVTLGMAVGSSLGALAVESYTQVGSTLDLAVCARSKALGGVTVGMPANCESVFSNPAWLGYSESVSTLSTVGLRPGVSGCGHIAASAGCFGLGMHYFDFGSVPMTDAFGNTIGELSYRTIGLVAGAGAVLGDLPIVSDSLVAECVGLGMSLKLLKIDTVDPGDGLGFAADSSFLLHADPPPFLQPMLSCISFGIVMENVLSTPIRYDTGYSEPWDREVSIGGSIELADRWLLALDLVGNGCVHMGLEWKPVSVLAVRVGAQVGDLWMLTTGLGLRMENTQLDLAFCTHPYLPNELCGSVVVDW